MLTYASLWHNFHIFQESTKCDNNMTTVCFLPHFNSMALIGHYLFAPYCGGTGYFMSPEMFINSPSLWIKALSEFKASMCMVPNFALDLAAAIKVPLDVDLSSLHFLGNGSESVSIDSIKCFYLKFSRYGLHKHALRSVYGLSEHTLHLCGSAEEDLTVMNVHVANGRPHTSVTVKIVDPDMCTEVADGEEGEIWVHSESKALGYWSKEELTKKVFHAELVGDKEKTYLRTGDMGFILSGSVFIAGRRENLMIVNGQRIYLSSIENRLESLFGTLRPGRAVAVEWDSTLALATSPRHSVSAAQPRPPRRGVAFFAELQNEDYLQAADCHVLAEKIAARIGIEFCVETLLVALLPLNMMPHTGSGKRQRPLCKANLLSGTLQVIYQWTPSTMISRPETHRTLRPEFIPLPPTPIPTKKVVADMKGTRKPSTEHTPPTVPALKLESPPQEEETATVARKESRFCLEDAPPVSKESGRSLEALAEAASHRTEVDLLDIPDGAEREKSKCLLGQENTVIDIISQVLGVAIEMDSNIWSHGCNSLKAVQISSQLEQHLGFSIEAHLLYAYQTPCALLEKLKRTLLQLCSPVATEQVPQRGPLPLPQGMMTRPSLLPSQDDDIAIISMACRFPGCDSPEELWQLLTEKAVPITHLQDPTSGKWIHGAFTNSMACFDHKWFEISKMEASRMDPQQSILLHTAWECLRRSGYRSPAEVKGSKMGVFIGFWGSDARSLSLSTDNHLPPCTSYIGAMTANRISYVFDLKGPSMAIDTACAASLTALEVACSYIHQGKCSQALVGGVNALLDPHKFRILSNMNMLSSKGESRVFDAECSGYVRGEGCGVVLLKRVGDALQDENRLLAVVKSVETFHNGEAATLTAPNKLTQSRLFRASLHNALLEPGDVSYIEAHSTGTPLGDPMEMNAIQDVFTQPDNINMPRVGPLIVGSIKSNIGHLEAGAGMAGLIKTVLVLEHAKVPGIPGLDTTNPSLKIDPDKILLPHEMVSLDKYYMYRPENSNLLCAGVNSFGIGGAITSTFLQQFSQLPHLGQVQCSLILGGEFGEVAIDEVMSVIQLLRARLRSFNSAYLSCLEAFQRAVKPVKVLASEAYYHHPAYLMFCLLYSMGRTLQAHSVDVSFLMGTNLCAEVVVLALADVLILSDAMRLLLAGMAPNVFNIRFIVEDEMQPTASFLSPTLNQLSLPGKFPAASLNQLIQEIQRTNLLQTIVSNPTLASSLVAIASGGYGSLLAITLQHNTPVMKAVTESSKSASILHLHNPGLIDHIRETCLQLRETSDQITSKNCENPASDVSMPGFYDRYPMRAIQHGKRPLHVQDQGNVHSTSSGALSISHSMKPKHRLSCGEESGYLTQATSAESLRSGYITQTTSAKSLKSSTPAMSPIKAQPLPADSLAQPLPTVSILQSKQQPTSTPTEQMVVEGVMDLIRNELVAELTQPDEEAAELGLLALGLDSMSLIELQDHLLNWYKIDMPLARITELGTVNAIAREVVEKCKCENSLLLDDTKKEKSLYKERLSPEKGYYTIPSIEELSRLNEEELKCIRNFTIGRSDYGKVEFLDKMDISQIDLQSQPIQIEDYSISLCEGSKSTLKNRPALLFFESVFSPHDASTVEDPLGELLKSLSGGATLVHSDDEKLVIKIDGFD